MLGDCILSSQGIFCYYCIPLQCVLTSMKPMCVCSIPRGLDAVSLLHNRYIIRCLRHSWGISYFGHAWPHLLGPSFVLIPREYGMNKISRYVKHMYYNHRNRAHFHSITMTIISNKNFIWVYENNVIKGWLFYPKMRWHCSWSRVLNLWQHIIHACI